MLSTFHYICAALLLAALVNGSPSAQKRALASVYTHCIDSKVAALMFDDGPAEYLEKISNELTTAGAKGTFFFTGTSSSSGCIYSQETVSRIKTVYSSGHMIASHTWSGAELTSLSSAQIVDSSIRMDEAFSRIFGVKPIFVSPPDGKYSNNALSVLSARNKALVLQDWDADVNTTQLAEKVYQKAYTNQPKNMLIQNGIPKEFTADTVIPYAITLLQKGYTLVSVAECLGLPAYSTIGPAGKRTSEWTCTGSPGANKGCTGSQCLSDSSPPPPPPPPPPSKGQTIRPGKGSATCLTASANTDGSPVVVKPCDNSSNQQWKQQGNTLTISGNKCLDVPNGSTTQGTKLQIWTCTTSNKNQQFSITSDLRIAWTGMHECLDLTDGKLTSGNRVQMWHCENGNTNQAWNFV